MGRSGPDEVPFTYFGSLVGIPASYLLAPGETYHKLERFYDLCHEHLHSACQGSPAESGVQLYSYSMVFFGSRAVTGLRLLHNLYVALLEANILIAGAVVPGMMAADRRFAIKNFYAEVPAGGLVDRATALVDQCQGARLIVDSDLAAELLPRDCRWDTSEGYQMEWDRHPEILRDDPRRFIATAADHPHHELLYYYRDRQSARLAPDETSRRLSQVSDKSATPNLAHYAATIGLIARCGQRALTGVPNERVLA